MDGSKGELLAEWGEKAGKGGVRYIYVYIWSSVIMPRKRSYPEAYLINWKNPVNFFQDFRTSRIQ